MEVLQVLTNHLYTLKTTTITRGIAIALTFVLLSESITTPDRYAPCSPLLVYPGYGHAETR